MSSSGRNESEAIARRAYEIWEAEGRPHGRDREHWKSAALELTGISVEMKVLIEQMREQGQNIE